MAQNLFRITVDEPNYGKVLGSPVEKNILENARLANLHGTRLWAQRDTQNGRQVFESMTSGDGLLFYKVQRGLTADEGRYVGVGRVGEKMGLEDEQAEQLFATRVARLAYTVTDFRDISKSIDDVDTILGYGSYPQSSHRVTNDRYQTVGRAIQELSH